MRLPRRQIAFCGFLGTAVLLFAFTRIESVVLAMFAMGLASFCSDLTMPISWDACVEIGGPYTATVAASMNMLGNFAGFAAPVVGGVILERTGGNWSILIYTMAVAAIVSALCWLYINPELARRQREEVMSKVQVPISPDGLQP
jgi:MFS family permease